MVRNVLDLVLMNVSEQSRREKGSVKEKVMMVQRDPRVLSGTEETGIKEVVQRRDLK